MARNAPSPLAKGKAKVYGPPTRASPRLAAMRARLAANSRPATPDAHATAAPPTARRTARISVKYYSMKLAERDGPSNAANNAPIEIHIDLEEEDPEIDPEEQEANLEGEMEEVEEEKVEVHHYDDDECEQMYIENYFEFAPAASSDESSAGPPPTSN
ncbi:hypothetical protein PIB30_061168 [Stylosanthes scabra]|uniref:Uncharacterized protein n=1 Tax=Stylosanthes scabra TaxID=79078 RepID=A0ABU6QLC0_9FABA|nr:hypothetical protein [Stylosanthes scabra]